MKKTHRENAEQPAPRTAPSPAAFFGAVTDRIAGMIRAVARRATRRLAEYLSPSHSLYRRLVDISG